MKIEEVSSVNNTAFAEMEAKTKVRVAGVIKTLEDKDTPYGSARKFKGDIALEVGDTVYVAKTAFFPNAIRQPIEAALAKVGKWDTFEFALTATKGADNTSWSVVLDTPPRNQQPRVLALLAD